MRFGRLSLRHEGVLGIGRQVVSLFCRCISFCLKSTLRNLSWDTVFVDNDIGASNACWYFLSCVDEFVPKVLIKDANRPPWIDKEVLL